MTPMPLSGDYRGELNDRLREADAVTAELISGVIGEACWRFPPIRRTEATARIERAIFDAAHRGSREKSIRERFRARSWGESAAELLERIEFDARLTRAAL